MKYTFPPRWIWLLVTMTGASCYAPRYVFSPATQNIPLLDHKNDLELSLGDGGSLNMLHARGNSYNGADLQGAWAISNHLAAILATGARWERSRDNDTYYAGDTSRLSYRGFYTEIGIGYYSPVRYNARMKFQGYAGMAFGNWDITDRYTSNGVTVQKYHDSRPTKIFLQPSLTYRLFKNSWVGFSSRLTAAVYRKIRTNYDARELDNYILDSLTVSPVFFWEPAVIYTQGFKKIPVRIRLQGSLAILVNRRFIQHRTGNVALGIVADFPKRRLHIHEKRSR